MKVDLKSGTSVVGVGIAIRINVKFCNSLKNLQGVFSIKKSTRIWIWISFGSGIDRGSILEFWTNVGCNLITWEARNKMLLLKSTDAKYTLMTYINMR